MPVNRSAGRSPVAYFSMEIALESGIPSYSGGLGVLAGDTLRSAADLGLRMIGITLAHREGYFRQQLDAAGTQTESPDVWSPEEKLEAAPVDVTVEIAGRPVHVRAWKYEVQGINGHTVPVYMLDTRVAENDEWARSLTDDLYGGDQRYRLAQEIVLGMGGVALLRALGSDDLVYHMNEGHSSLLTLALLEERLGERGPATAERGDVEAVRKACVFTTHTPVPAGHDQFPAELASELLGEERLDALRRTGALIDGTLNMTHLGLHSSRYINGVSMRHGEMSLGMFPEYPVAAITNGVHAMTWVSGPFAELYDRHVPDWRHDNLYLRYAIKIPVQEIRDAHLQAKRSLLHAIEERTGVHFGEEIFTLGFARRATPYKRADFLLRDPGRLNDISQRVGRLQVVYAGKAHPRDEAGKQMIRRIFERSNELCDAIRVVYLQDYDVELARLLTAGVDLWLNTPRRPQEASGTSGMKAALNGVPSLSVLDGWWIEGHLEGVTGWSIPHGHYAPEDETGELHALYDKLERVILPMYYGQPPAYGEVMRSAIALNGSFFNTQRMLSQYVLNAYYPLERREQPQQTAPV